MSWGVLSTKEVADVLGVSGARVRQLVAEGQLTADRSGRSMLFEREDVERYRSTRTRQATLPDAPAVETSAASSAPTPNVATPTANRAPTAPAVAPAAPVAGLKELQEKNARLEAECRRLQTALDQALALVGTLHGLTVDTQ